MVIWIIGLSGAGKSTLANEIVRIARQKIDNIVLIDGDIIRKVYGDNLGYTLSERQINASRVCRLCKHLDDQGIHVVSAILSIFEESRTWNRKNICSYYEVFIDVAIERLKAQDSKGLYRRGLNGSVKNVVGIDLEFVHPKFPDLVIKNDGDIDKLLGHAPLLAARTISEND